MEGKPALKADIVVIAMGAWSGIAKHFFPMCRYLPHIQGSRHHSIIIEAEVSSEAIFVQYKDGSQIKESEIYPRPDGTVYICGESDGAALPEDPGQVNPRLDACQSLHKVHKQFLFCL